MAQNLLTLLPEKQVAMTGPDDLPPHLRPVQVDYLPVFEELPLEPPAPPPTPDPEVRQEPAPEPFLRAAGDNWRVIRK